MKIIVLLEDDQILGGALSERLEKEGYKVLWGTSIKQVREFLSTKEINLFLLDVGLPDGNGFNFAREIREIYSLTSPIVFLTAMSNAEYRLEGYEIGAEDYIPKPFHLKELLLRIEKIIKRYDVIKEVGLLNICDQSMTLRFRDGRKEFPIKRDFELIKFLYQESPRVISREEVLKTVWAYEGDLNNERSVDNAIVRIRGMLGKECESMLRSVRGVGYQWVEDVL